MEKYSPKELIKATEKGSLYDYIALYYSEMSQYDLKEVLLTLLGLGYDACKGEADEKEYARLITEELADRGFGEEE